MPDDTTPRNQAQPPAIPGPQAGQDDSLPRNEADYQRLLAEMEARYSGSSLPPETALKFLLDDDETTWCHPEALALLAMFRHDPIMWLSITTYAHKRYVSTRLLTAAVDAHMAEQTPQRQPATPATSTADQLPYSDYTNALALVRAHGANLRYCYPWKSWLVWTGTHWQRDQNGAVMRLAKQTVRRLARQVEDIENDVAARALLAHVKKSLSTSALEAMIRSAQSEPGIAIQPEDLDTDYWLLNCTNGTVDLKTGVLRPQARTDLITKCLAIAYDPDAQCPRWDGFLKRIMGGSQGADHPDMGAGELENRRVADAHAQELIDFLQRIVGYSLTGSTSEQCMFILYGITKTGKSTFLGILRAVLGPYGKQADMESFMHKDRQEVRNDLADLAGCRLVCALESQEGRRLAESLIKHLTGGVDPYKARFLFQEYFEFVPQFKLFIGTNHKPVIKDTDSAIWERVRLVPFDVQIPKTDRDKTLEARLREELPGILAWAVRGCLEWKKLGELKEPAAVEQATQSYREEMDDVGRFLKDVCLLQTVDKEGKPLPPEYKTKASILLKAYQQWSGQSTETPKSFAAKLTNLGYESKHGNTGNFWQGIGLHAEGADTDI